MMHDDLHSIASGHNEAVRIERLTNHIQRIRESQDKMEATLGKLADAVARLALVEDRQSATSTVIECLSEVIEKLDDRLRKLEVAEPMEAKASEWVMNAVWALCAAAAMFVAAKAGLI